MTEAGVSARRSQTRERLIDAAVVLFAEKGVLGASVEEICERAEFTRGAFYSNFADKDALVHALIEQGAPVDLVFQSVAGTQAANASFGVTLSLLQEGLEAGRSQKRGTVGDNVMYFETGQGAALSANAHHDVDQQTLEARAYAVARAFDPPG